MDDKDKMLFINEKCTKHIGFDIGYYIYDKLKKRGIEKSVAPLVVGLKVTDRCTFNCKNCFVKKGTTDMTLDTFYRILNSFPQKPYYIYLTGGDPFLNPNIFKIIDELYKRGILVKIHSTGVLSNETLDSLVANCHKIHSIQLSIDSISDLNFYRESNYKDPLSKMINFVETMNSKINLTANFVLSTENKDKIYEVIDFCSKYNIHRLKISSIMTNKEFLVVKDEDNLDYYMKIVEYALMQKVDIMEEPYCHPLSLKYKHFFKQTTADKFFCPAQKTEMEIDMLGNVYPCPFLYNEKHRMGNILKDDFNTIWHSGVKNLNHLEWSESKVCKKCEVYSLCGGGCYAFAEMNCTCYDKRCNLNEKDVK